MSAREEEKKEKILYVQTRGLDDPERLYTLFNLALNAVATDVTAYIFFVGEGITVMRKGVAEKIHYGDFPPLSQVIERAYEVGVNLLILEESCRQYGLNRRDFYKKALLVGEVTLNDQLLTTDAAISF